MFQNSFGKFEQVECGLVQLVKISDYEEKKVPIPLVSVSVVSSVVHAVGQVEVTQVYMNKENVPIEAIYFFPVDSNGGVTYFHAEIDGRIIKGIAKEHEEAKAQYEKAVQNNQTAFMVEQNKPDIFKVKVGFLKPGCQAKIVIGYITEVKNEGDSIRFFIPTTIAPRYVPPTANDEKSKEIANMKFSENSSAPLSIKVSVSIQGSVKNAESPTHKIKIVEKCPIPQKPNWTKVSIELDGKTTDMDLDFVLMVTPEEKSVPRLYMEKIENSTAIMSHFIPSFKLDDQKNEIIFVLDRSGSMGGPNINLAKKALTLFLHSLPVNCYFNIVGFGSRFEFLFPESVQYEDGSLQKALHHAQIVDANLGGTEIFRPLQEIYGKKLIPGYLRQIFVLTDGQVSNTEQVIGLVRKHSHESRLFSLGIGDSASHHLVDSIAEVGGGTSDFVTYNESLNNKVLQQLKNALQPSLTDIVIAWDRIDSQVEKQPEINKEKTLMGYGKPIDSLETTSKVDFRQSPEKICPIFDGSQMVFFGIFKNNIVPSSLTITASSPDGPLTLNIPLSEENYIGSTGMLHKLAAIKIIKELELKIDTEGNQNDFLKKEIIEIACKHGLASKYTSFVAVDESKESDISAEAWMVMQTRQTRQIPNQLYGSRFKTCALNLNPPSRGPEMEKSTRFLKFCSMAPPQMSSPASSLISALSFSANSQQFGSAGVRQLSAIDRPSIGGITERPIGQDIAFGMPNQHIPYVDLSGFIQVMTKLENDDLLLNLEKNECSSTNKLENMDAQKLDTSEDRLHALISCQTFNGSFILNEKFANAINQKLVDIKKESITNGWDENTFATALALAYFEKKLSDLKDQWELVSVKARKWLAQNHASILEKMTKTALEFIK